MELKGPEAEDLRIKHFQEKDQASDQKEASAEKVGLSDEAVKGIIEETQEQYELAPSEAARPGIKAGQEAVADYQKNRSEFEARETQKKKEDEAKAAQITKELAESETPTVEQARVEELNKRALWFRQFASRVTSEPETIGDTRIHLFISYIEEFKEFANTENQLKIDNLIKSLRLNPPETAEGSALFVKAAYGFADQYERLAQRETKREKGISREQRVAETPYTKPEYGYEAPKPKSKPMTGGSLLWKKVKGWFSKK